MKKVFGLLILLTCAFVSEAQVKYAYDTLNGNEFVAFPPVGFISVTGQYRTLSIDVTCTELGGTSDGTIILQARNGADAEWSTINSGSFSNYVNFLSNDTLTITDGAVWKIEVHEPGFTQYRLYGDGTASDTTKVELWWALK